MSVHARARQHARQQAGRWRDLLWRSVLEEFAERDATAYAAARAAIRAQPIRALYGASTCDAKAAWPHLDEQARLDWEWVCQYVDTIGIEVSQLETATNERNGP